MLGSAWSQLGLLLPKSLVQGDMIVVWSPSPLTHQAVDHLNVREVQICLLLNTLLLKYCTFSFLEFFIVYHICHLYLLSPFCKCTILFWVLIICNGCSITPWTLGNWIHKTYFSFNPLSIASNTQLMDKAQLVALAQLLTPSYLPPQPQPVTLSHLPPLVLTCQLIQLFIQIPYYNHHLIQTLPSNKHQQHLPAQSCPTRVFMHHTACQLPLEGILHLPQPCRLQAWCNLFLGAIPLLSVWQGK